MFTVFLEGTYNKQLVIYNTSVWISTFHTQQQFGKAKIGGSKKRQGKIA